MYLSKFRKRFSSHRPMTVRVVYILLPWKFAGIYFLQAFRIRLYLSKFRTDSLFIAATIVYLLLEKMIEFNFLQAFRIHSSMEFPHLKFRKDPPFNDDDCVFWNLFPLTFRMDDGISFVTIRLNFLLLKKGKIVRKDLESSNACAKQKITRNVSFSA